MTASDDKRLVLQDTAWCLRDEVSSPVAGSRAHLWTSETLDSRRYNCMWHRLEFEDLEIGPGDVLTVFTRTSNVEDKAEDQGLPTELQGLIDAGRTRTRTREPGLPVARLGSAVHDVDTSWRLNERLVGGEAPVRRFKEVLVQAGRGQYLIIALHLVRKLEADRHARWTPAASHDPERLPWRLVRVIYPRRSLLDHLPAIYREDPIAGDFLERWLAVFQHDWDEIERLIAMFHLYLDPKFAQAPQALRYLADWFGIKFDGAWLEGDADDQAVRNFILTSMAKRSRRGTPDAAEAVLRAWFDAAGLPTQGGRLPQIVEGFRVRRYLAFGASARGRLGRSAPLSIDPGATAARLDSGARLGQTSLPPGGKTALGGEALDQFGHRTIVFVPSCPDRAREIERAVADVFPAAQLVEQRAVEPGICLANDSILGVNTLLAGGVQAPQLEV